ncbi:(-)-germacrene D synthase-like [Ipomoea triloba]|uniref:(-)-germacrene D synthase-like n=1 Tax=Ipomoea triloba TaxID=35885 RepID=UPI00125E2D90|nr:(-)-germacrene D synthase-like [Ipomoea triloba]
MDVNGNSSGRRSVTYHPTVWGDYFLAYDSKLTEIDPSEEREVQQLKEEVRKLLIAAPLASLEKLELVDKIQRLGVDYHFENEIEASIQYIFDNYDNCNKGDGENNLYVVALRFRLLRQEGHHISCGVFEKFLDKDGKFKDSLTKDVEGMLSLYEASYLGLPGETTLDEALTFTTGHLESMLPSLNKFEAAQVTHALKLPIRRTLPRVGAKEYMQIYQQDQTHNKVLLRFAKLDFNLLQKVHQRELSGITKWWKDLDVPKTLPFARDRLAECYFWILGVYFEPQYHFSRRITTQIICIWSVLDDLYDVYGTKDELQLFTNAIQRFETSASDEVPQYLKKIYLAILDITTEMEEVMAKENKLFHVSYAIGEMKKQIRTYYQEFMWFYTKHVPPFEEYLKVSLVSSCYMMIATTCLVGMGDIITKEVLDWVTSEPLAVKATCSICRLMDDMIGHEFEQERGHVASAVECYMKGYNVSKEEAYVGIEKLISRAWKDINQECLHPLPVPMKVLLRVLNLARAIFLIYKDNDIYTFSQVKFKSLITVTLVQPATI